VPWRELPKKDRQWILFTEDQPQVPVYPGRTPEEVRRALKRKEPPDYMGTFTSAQRHVLHTFATTQSAAMKRRVAQYMLSGECPACHGKRLRPEALRVTFAGLDIADMSRLPLTRVAALLRPAADGTAADVGQKGHPEQAVAAQRITHDVVERLAVLLDLGLGYLSLERSTPTLSPGELQRLRLATQVRSNLFGVVYVLDEPSAGLHPADTEALLVALDRLKASGNSLFVVEHDLDVVRRADWIVDVGPAAGEHGGHVLYSGPWSSRRPGAISSRGPPSLQVPSEPREPRAAGCGSPASPATTCTGSTSHFRSAHSPRLPAYRAPASRAS
jgi:excinuclease ABC subunit A